MGVNSLPKTVTRQHRDCDLNPSPSAPESSTLTTRLPWEEESYLECKITQWPMSGHSLSWIDARGHLLTPHNIPLDISCFIQCSRALWFQLACAQREMYSIGVHTALGATWWIRWIELCGIFLSLQSTSFAFRQNWHETKMFFAGTCWIEAEVLRIFVSSCYLLTQDSRVQDLPWQS